MAVGLLSAQPVLAEESIPEPPGIAIGVLGPLTARSQVSLAQLRGATMAVDEYNRSRQAGEPEVSLLIADNQGDPKESVRQARFLSEAGAAVILGPVRSSSANEIIRDFLGRGEEIPVVATGPTATRLQRHPYFFRCNITDQKRLDFLLTSALKRFGHPRVVLVYEQDDPYGEGLRKDALELLKAYEVRIKEWPYKGFIAREQALADIKELRRQGFSRSDDAYFFMGLSADARLFLEAMRATGTPSAAYIPEPNSRILRDAANAGVDITGLRSCVIWWDDNPSAYVFKDAFREKFHLDAHFSSPLSHDATLKIIAAIRQVAKREPEALNDLPRLRQKLREALLTAQAPKKLLALPGTHEFNGKQEYEDLEVVGLHYAWNGRAFSWDQPLPEKPPAPDAFESEVIFPDFWAVLVLYLSAALGSALRRVSHARVATLKAFKKCVVSPSALLVDPIVAALIFNIAYLGVLATKPELLGRTESAENLFLVGASVIGGLSGFLGTEAINRTLAVFKINTGVPDADDIEIEIG